MTAGVMAGLRQLELELLRLRFQEGVRDLDQNARAVPGDGIGADRAAVLEILQDAERVFDQLMRLATLEVGNEADAASIVFARWIKEALGSPCREQAKIGIPGAVCSMPGHRLAAFWLRRLNCRALARARGTAACPEARAWAGRDSTRSGTPPVRWPSCCGCPGPVSRIGRWPQGSTSGRAVQAADLTPEIL